MVQKQDTDCLLRIMMIIRVMMSKAKQDIFLCNFKTGIERPAHLRGEDEVEFGGQAETRQP